MLRIPNPASNLNIILHVFRDIYGILKSSNEFGLDEISRALVARNNVTSQGAIGEEALRRSTRRDRSRDQIYNQSKMYAELFRWLGWIQSTTSKLCFSFSLLGEHVATAHNPSLLFRECLLGIAGPNEELSGRAQQTVRAIGGPLLVMDSLGSISRDEMIAGPLSIADDSDPKAVRQMMERVADCRKQAGALDRWIQEISAARGIARTTMENYTRFAVAAFPWSGWGVKNGGAIHITADGKAMAARLRNAPDVRLANFLQFPAQAKPAFVRWTFYSMLERAGFDVETVRARMDADVQLLAQHGLPCRGDVFFSPFQQLRRETLRQLTPELVVDHPPAKGQMAAGRQITADLGSNDVPSRRSRVIFELSQHVREVAEESSMLRSEIQHALAVSGGVEAATAALCAAYKSANEDVFYPLVANLFRALGFDCRASRRGQNYQRADAIILDEKRSIPIEIKSPGEETEISVKGVRQALENKIVLLSRKSYPTDKDTTSLVVGFNPPNARSEVHELIQDIHRVFGIRVGVIDFYSLLSLVVHSVHSGKQVSIRDFHLLKGVIHVEPLTATS